MIDRSLLSRLPTPTLIKLASLSASEAVDHLRHAASLCLDGARSLTFQDEQQQELANKLIKDAMILYDMAFLRQLYRPSAISSDSIHLNASANDLPLPLTPWDEQFAQEIASGARCAEHWLGRRSTQPLWWQLTQARQGYPEGGQRDAFEAGFLRHLQRQLIKTRYKPPDTPSI
ncbi:LasR-specific antiactivator QslA [Pseudomonas asplenii]|uniref:LasR-specific antiactivator QslA n=1 Tax=Pseudomonas asplenii TaxID=53407 RepID=UPI0003725F95|nr:LasR-specific antiactivator QslA [Pseudomonas fuscovaginae]